MDLLRAWRAVPSRHEVLRSRRNYLWDDGQRALPGGETLNGEPGTAPTLRPVRYLRVLTTATAGHNLSCSR